VDGREIQPPAWEMPGQYPADLEALYTNEPYQNRPPLPIQLKKGWNRVLIKVPVGAFQTTDYQLVKWLFTFVFVRPGGPNYEAADGLVVSPDKRR